MHKTLLTQVEDTLGESPVITQKLAKLFEAISHTYDSFDREKADIENSMQHNSDEMQSMIALLRVTLDSINEGILVVSKDGKVVNHNKRLMDIWQLPESVLLDSNGDTVMNLFLERMSRPDIFKRNINEVFVQSNRSCLFVIECKDGKTIEMSSKPELVEEENFGRVWSFRDVTDQLKAQSDLKAKLEALERLNRAMIDRELRMVKLKEENKMLRESLEEGRAPAIHI